MKNFADLEHSILNSWHREDTFGKLQKQNASGVPWSFMDGPVTANNRLGVHHGWGRTYKDIFNRYHAMQGKNLRWQNGFDCHGLWVEVEVEKDNNFKNKKDIVEHGVRSFVTSCRDRVVRFAGIQTQQSQRLGQWMDWEKSYFTHHKTNIEHIWKFLAKCSDLNLIEKGERVMPWCTRCGCSLSQHELVDSYTNEFDKAIYFKCALEATGEYLLVWTTTPWTIPANLAIAVHPKETYIALKKDHQTLWLSEKCPLRKELEKEGYGVVGAKQGSELVGKLYWRSFVATKGSVVGWEDIIPESGTGIVHIAPGCGIEDFKLGKSLRMIPECPLDENGVFKLGTWHGGKHYTEINKDVIKALDSMLFKEEPYQHRIPRCWRCKERLVYRLCNEWFIKMNPLRQRLKEAAAKINWIPASSGDQIQNWLDNMGDWCISRRRFWGVPLPFYTCDDCGETKVIGSFDELIVRTAEAGCPIPKDLDLHRPAIDNYFLKCDCGHEAIRVSEVGDCWLDAGMAPLSTLGLAAEFERKWFPYDFAVEMREQVRLWFYSSIVMSVVMTNEPPFKNVLTHEDMRDKNGEPFSKSKGNAPSLDTIIEQYGADPLRYTLAHAPITQPYRWDEKNIKESQKKLLTIWNCYSFYQGYAKLYSPEIKSPIFTTHIDKWIAFSLQATINKVRDSLDSYDVALAIKTIETFALHDLSHWYIRIKRHVFAHEKEKAESFNVLYYVLNNLAKLLAPFVPFIAEEFSKMLGNKRSVHLAGYPTKLATDRVYLKNMDILRDIVSLGLKIRENSSINLRQPLRKLKFSTTQNVGVHIMLMQDIICHEVNVKSVSYSCNALEPSPTEIKAVDKDIEVLLDCALSDELVSEGMARTFIRHVQGLRKKTGLVPGDRIKIICQPPKGIANHMTEIMNKTNCNDFTIEPVPKELTQEEVNLGNSKYLVGIAKV